MARGDVPVSRRAFIPNGCTSSPDAVGDVAWKGCCDIHDLAYHLGGKNVLRKWQSDAGLGWCMAKRWGRSVMEPVPWWRRVGRAVGAVFVPVGYVAVTATAGLAFWNWRGNPVPSHEELAALEGVNVEALEAVAKRERA